MMVSAAAGAASTLDRYVFEGQKEEIVNDPFPKCSRKLYSHLGYPTHPNYQYYDRIINIIARVYDQQVPTPQYLDSTFLINNVHFHFLSLDHVVVRRHQDVIDKLELPRMELSKGELIINHKRAFSIHNKHPRSFQFIKYAQYILGNAFAHLKPQEESGASAPSQPSIQNTKLSITDRIHMMHETLYHLRGLLFDEAFYNYDPDLFSDDWKGLLIPEDDDIWPRQSNVKTDAEKEEGFIYAQQKKALDKYVDFLKFPNIMTDEPPSNEDFLSFAKWIDSDECLRFSEKISKGKRSYKIEQIDTLKLTQIKEICLNALKLHQRLHDVPLSYFYETLTILLEEHSMSPDKNEEILRIINELISLVNQLQSVLKFNPSFLISQITQKLKHLDSYYDYLRHNHGQPPPDCLSYLTIAWQKCWPLEWEQVKQKYKPPKIQKDDFWDKFKSALRF